MLLLTYKAGARNKEANLLQVYRDRWYKRKGKHGCGLKRDWYEVAQCSWWEAGEELPTGSGRCLHKTGLWSGFDFPFSPKLSNYLHYQFYNLQSSFHMFFPVISDTEIIFPVITRLWYWDIRLKYYPYFKGDWKGLKPCHCPDGQKGQSPGHTWPFSPEVLEWGGSKSRTRRKEKEMAQWLP